MTPATRTVLEITIPGVVGGAVLYAVLYAVLMVLVGCTPSQVTQADAILSVACRVDGVVQPIAVALAPLAGQQVAALAAADQQLVHPMVVAACAGVGGKPISVGQAG